MANNGVETPQVQSTRDSLGIQDLSAFMKEQDEADAAAEARRVSTHAVVAAKDAAKIAALLPPPAEIDFGTTNWVGKLFEYRQAYPHETPSTFSELPVGEQRFTCTVRIAETTEEFPGEQLSFSNKKDAKKYACKCAIEWLISNGFLSPGAGIIIQQTKAIATPKVTVIGGPRRPQSSIASPSPGITDNTNNSPPPPNISNAARVANMCKTLGFSPPTYEIKPHPDASAMYSGYAHFGGDPRIQGQKGEFRNVHGRKNAKEKCAEGVLEHLEAIRRSRLEMLVRPIDGSEASEVADERWFDTTG